MDLIIHILDNLPKEFERVVESLQADLDDDVLASLERVRAKLRAKFARLHKFKNEKLGTKTEKVLMQREISQFKRQCWACGEYGH